MNLEQTFEYLDHGKFINYGLIKITCMIRNLNPLYNPKISFVRLVTLIIKAVNNNALVQHKSSSRI